MRMSMTAVLILLTATSAVTAQRPAALFEGCRACHGMPQPDIAGDDLWIGRVATTACVTPAGPRSAKKRSALMAWLRADARERPHVERTARPPSEGYGTVKPTFAEGSVLLGPAGGVGDDSVTVRLVWNGEKGASALRTVPVGKWEVRGYRMQRTDGDGIRWQIWASGNRGRKVVVTAKKTAVLDLDLRVHVKPRAAVRRGKLSMGVAVTGDSRMGLTVVRGRSRVPASYSLVCEDRAIEGRLAYG